MHVPQWLIVFNCAAQPALRVPSQFSKPTWQVTPQLKTSFWSTQLGVALAAPGQPEQLPPQPTFGSFFATQSPEQTFWPELHIEAVSIPESRTDETSRSVGSSMPRRLPHAAPKMANSERVRSPIKELHGRRLVTPLR